MKTEGLRVLTTIPAAPTTLYLAWLSSKQHGAMTSGNAKIEPVVGSDFSALSGYITGKLVVLDLGRRLVMSWRTTDFPHDAVDSRVEIFFEALGGSTRVTVLHRDIPHGQAEQYKATWNEKYFVPMRAFFSKFLPDPRDPPPPRRPMPPPDDYDKPQTPLQALKARKARLSAPARPVLAEKKVERPAPAPPEEKTDPPPPVAKQKKAEKAEKAPPPKVAEVAKKPAPPAKPAKQAAAPPAKKAAAPPPTKKKAAPPSKPAKKKKK